MPYKYEAMLKTDADPQWEERTADRVQFVLGRHYDDPEVPMQELRDGGLVETEFATFRAVLEDDTKVQWKLTPMERIGAALAQYEGDRDSLHVEIPGYDPYDPKPYPGGILPGVYAADEVRALIARHEGDEEALQFIADMLEE